MVGSTAGSGHPTKHPDARSDRREEVRSFRPGGGQRSMHRVGPLPVGTLDRLAPAPRREGLTHSTSEHMFATVRDVEPHELERLRRSIVMMPPGHSAGALTREAALRLVDGVVAARSETTWYRRAVAQLKQVIDALEAPATGSCVHGSGRRESQRQR